MKESTDPVTDPDGQSLMNTLAGLGVGSGRAYNTVQGVRNMAGQNVVVEIDTKIMETNAKIVETNATILTTIARSTAETNARIAENRAQLKALAWMLCLLLIIVGMIATALVAAGLYAVIARNAPVVQLVLATASDPPPMSVPAETSVAAETPAPETGIEGN